MKQEVKIGQIDYTVLVLIRDTAGAPKTGLTNVSAGIDVCYTRVETDNDVVLTDGALVALATPALTDPHLDWGFLQVDATKAPGLYRLDIPDGVFATGAWSAVVSLIGTGLDPAQLEFILVPESPYAGVNVSKIGGTIQTAGDVVADVAAIHVHVDDIHDTDLPAVKADTAAILIDTGTTLDGRIPAALVGGRMDVSVGAMAAGVVTASAIATDAIDADSLAADALAEINAQADLALTDIHLDHLLAVDYDPAAKPGVATALLNELIESDAGVSRFTANALENAPSGTGASADVIADAVWDELVTGHDGAGKAGAQLWTDVDAIKAKTDNLPNDPADESLLEAAITAATSPLATGAALAVVGGYIDTEVVAIKAKTDLIGASVALETGGNIASIKTVVDNIHDTDLPAVKADTAAILIDTGTTLDGRIPAALVGGRIDASVGAMAAGVVTAASIATDAIDADALAADAVDEILDEVVEGTITLRQALRILLSALAGKSTGGGTATLTFRDIADSKPRITATVDVNGNRTAIVRDGT